MGIFIFHFTYPREVVPGIMSPSIPAGYISPPPGNPWENFFKRANPGQPGNFLFNSPAPGQNDGRIPGGGTTFSQTRRNCSLSLQKII